jgi:hypothetical protein
MSHAECHTAEVVSRDVGFRPAVPLPAVAILLRALLLGAPTCISQGLNGLRLFGNHCLSFYRRTQLGERLTHFHSRSLAYDYCGLGALANGTELSRCDRGGKAAEGALGCSEILGAISCFEDHRSSN